MSFGRRPRKKPQSPAAEARARALEAALKDAEPPAEGWPEHYSVRGDYKHMSLITIHHCGRCGGTMTSSRDRGSYPLRSRGFATLHRDCTPTPESSEAEAPAAEVPDGL